MRRILTLALTVLTCGLAAAQSARSVLEQAQKTMGNPKTIQYTGSGATFTLGQNPSPDKPWPRVELRSLTRVFDYQTQSSRTEATGPAGPLATQFLSGDKAWGQTPAGAVNPAPPVAVADRQMQLWLSPHGFLQGALAASVKAKSRKVGDRKVTEISFTQGKNRLVGTISADGTVEKVETWVDNAVLGDMHVEAGYSSYRDFGGVKHPNRIVLSQGGFPTFELNITAVQAGVAAGITVPDAVRNAAPPAATVNVTSEKLGNGVWLVGGGTHHSIAVEFKDHAAVIEGPQNDARSAAVIAEVKKLIPNKPIRLLVSTHHHFDHSGGVRAYIAEGATVAAHPVNVEFYKRIAKAPHNMNPDRLAREKKRAKVTAVSAKHVLTDGTRMVELHHIQGSPHHDGILMAYFPAEKILAEVDVYTPAAANATLPPPSPAALNLNDNIERLKLAVDRIVPLHGRIVTLAEFKKAIGK